MSEHLRMMGKFSLPTQYIEEQPDVVMQLFANTIVVRAELMFQSKAIDYVLLHPDFEVVPEGVDPPEYDAEVDSEGNVTWQRK